jgi:hypothetical protein
VTAPFRKINDALVAEARRLRAAGVTLVALQRLMADRFGAHAALCTWSRLCRGGAPVPPPRRAVDPAIALYRREKAKHGRRWRPRWREINARLAAMEARAPDFRHFVVGGDRTIPDEYLPPRGLEDWCP